MAEALRENHCSPEKFYVVYCKARSKADDVSYGHRPPRPTIIGTTKRFRKSTPTRDRKPPKFETAEALREPRSSKPQKVLRNLPQREIQSRRSLRRPQPSENDYLRSAETFYKFYRNARSKAAKSQVRASQRSLHWDGYQRKLFADGQSNSSTSGSSDYPSSHLSQHALCITHHSLTLTCTPTQALSQPISELRRSQDTRFEQRGTSSPSQINDSKLWSYEPLGSSRL
ncbi:hypothetical protein NPIL_262691 [Nephila pilipes]|uniref:Uncharacterized protein n=1 Tax=Nephila pilipes TaxID=299642 RepID=A0A8X6QRS2_NEPPI|nr:hypothetical protein NPIL_262691 [Nephila pilipes]